MAGRNIITILNDLVTINKDRIVGYKEILHELKSETATEHCRQMIHQSEKHNEEIGASIKEAGGHIEDKTSTAGIIYNMWMDIMYSYTKEPLEDIYNYCRQMEETTLKAYDTALKEIGPKRIKEYDLILCQRQELDTSLSLLDEIRL